MPTDEQLKEVKKEMEVNKKELLKALKEATLEERVAALESFKEDIEIRLIKICNGNSGLIEELNAKINALEKEQDKRIEVLEAKPPTITENELFLTITENELFLRIEKLEARISRLFDTNDEYINCLEVKKLEGLNESVAKLEEANLINRIEKFEGIINWEGAGEPLKSMCEKCAYNFINSTMCSNCIGSGIKMEDNFKPKEKGADANPALPRKCSDCKMEAEHKMCKYCDISHHLFNPKEKSESTAPLSTHTKCICGHFLYDHFATVNINTYPCSNCKCVDFKRENNENAPIINPNDLKNAIQELRTYNEKQKEKEAKYRKENKSPVLSEGEKKAPKCPKCGETLTKISNAKTLKRYRK